MNSALRADFADFVEHRLDFIDKKLFANPEHIALEAKLKTLESAVSKKFDTDIGSLDDGFMELLALCQRATYRQGFMDGLSFMASS